MSEQKVSVQRSLRERLDKRPEERAWTFVQKNGEFEWASFADFYGRASASASLLSERGLRKGDVAVLVLQSDERAANVLMGSLLLGAVPLLVAPPIVQGLHSNLTEVVAHVVGRAGSKFVVTDDDATDSTETVGDASVRLASISEVSSNEITGAVPLVEPDPEAYALLQLTSGTTGFPRICAWKHQNVLAALNGMVAGMKLSREDIFLNWTPLYHDMGLVNNFLVCMVQGIALAMMEPTSFVRKPSRWLRALNDTGATTTWSPNFGFALAAERASDKDLGGVRLDGVKGFWNAAERVHYETILAFHERFEPYGLRLDALKTNFGCAENIGGATFSDAHGRFTVEHVDRQALQERRVAEPRERSESTSSFVGVGRPYPGMTIHIVDEKGESLPDAHIGEIALDTPSTLHCFLDDPEATEQTLKGGLVRTGDYGYMRNGELFWTGRVRERINIFGKKYDPSDFEVALSDVEGVRPGCFAAFGTDDGARGTQRLVIVTEIRADAPPRDTILGTIQDHMTRRLGIRADEIVLLPSGTMSKTSSGKRRHRFYKELFEIGELQELERQAELSE